MSDITDAELKRALAAVDLLLKRRQLWWEGLKGAATMLAAAAVFLGFVLAGINWLRPPAPQQITVHIDQPLHVKVDQ